MECCDLTGNRGRPSATSECLNWVTLGAMMAKTDLTMEELAYEPRLPHRGGHGAGLGFARWS